MIKPTPSLNDPVVSSDERDLIEAPIVIRGPTPPGFPAAGCFVVAKSQCESFKAGGKTIKLRQVGRTPAGHARNRGVSHRNFHPNTTPRVDMSGETGGQKAAQRIVEGEMSARFDVRERATQSATVTGKKCRRELSMTLSNMCSPRPCSLDARAIASAPQGPLRI